MSSAPKGPSDDELRRPLLSDGGTTTTGDQESDTIVQSETAERGGGTFSRNLGVREAFAIVISIVIGSGIFTSPGSIDSNVPSPGVALVVWLVGGLLAWTGAATMAELGTAIPGEGGVQPYLQYIWGDAFGFLAAWTWVIAVMPATLAILSIVFIESIFSAAGVTDQASNISHKLLSVLILVVINVANSISTKASTRLNGFFVVTKFAAIAAVVLAAIVVAIMQAQNPHHDQIGGRNWFTQNWFTYRDSRNQDGSMIHWSALATWDMLGHFSSALYGALWAYSGWDKAIYISAEMSSPERQLPLAINMATPTIILCFIAANAAYYILLPWDIIATTDSVAVTAITRLLGPGFGMIAAMLICLVVAGSLLGNSFVAGRMAVAAAKRGWLPTLFASIGRVSLDSSQGSSPSDDDHVAHVDEYTGMASDNEDSQVGSFDGSNGKPAPWKSDAPFNALILSTALSTVYILFGSFRALLTFNGLGEYSFFFLAVLGSIVLRVREPNLRRPYQPPIIVPAVFAVVSAFVVVRGAIFEPLLALLLVTVWAIGMGFYLASKALGWGRV